MIYQKTSSARLSIARQVRVTVPVHLAPLSWTTFQLLEGEQEYRDGIYQNGVIDAPFVTVSVDEKTSRSTTRQLMKLTKMLFALKTVVTLEIV